MVMPFGRFRGTPLGDIPQNYLLWLLDGAANVTPTLRREIERVLELDEQQRPPVPAVLGDVVGPWHRRMAKKFHPDRPGGSHQAMIAVNVGRDLLVEMLEATA